MCSVALHRWKQRTEKSTNNFVPSENHISQDMVTLKVNWCKFTYVSKVQEKVNDTYIYMDIYCIV